MPSQKKLLLFNISESKATLIKTVCDSLAIRVVKIYRPQYGETIGALAGLPAFPMTNVPYSGEDFTQEMMVICGLNSNELDVFLAAWRDAGIPPVWRKAALTPTNRQWTAARLYGELDREHRQMTGQ